MKSKTTEIMLALPGTLLFLFIFLPFFFIWIPYKFLSSFNYIFLFDIGVFRYCGWIPIVLGVVIYFWCSLMFLFIGKGTPLFLPPNKKLVLKGLYRYVRNPMYIGAMLITLGEGLLFQSISLFIYALAVFGVCNFNILILEEPYLANKFGESYAQYRKSVRRWIPRLTPYKENDSVP